MQFNSALYLVFLAVVACAHSRMAPRSRLWLVLAASYAFYGYWDPRFLALIAGSSTIDYLVARQVHQAPSRRAARRWLMVSLVANLGALGFFKYYNFFVTEIASGLRGFGLEPGQWTLEIVLPVGISFYTFQTLAYTIDVYRRDTDPESDYLTFLCYVAFFPQLVAGPIERANRLLPQLKSPARPAVARGVSLIVRGLFLKVVVGDTAATLTNRVFEDPMSYSGLMCLLAVYGFAIQIYGDFAGYTSIARGSAALLGVRLTRNFAQPYLSRSITEFWRRWHISLSSWLRDYLYVPLGGNRRGARRTYINLMTVMALGGLWHGAAWTFVVWGVLHGACLAAERLSGRTSRREDLVWRDLFSVVVTFHIVCLGWVFFRAGSTPEALAVLGQIGTWASGDAAIQSVLIPPLLALVFALDLWARGYVPAMGRTPWAQGALYGGAIIALIICWDREAVPFIYFQF